MTIRGSVLRRGKTVSLPQNVQTRSGAQPPSYSVDFGIIFAEVQRQGIDVDRTQVYGAEIENVWLYNSTPLYASWRGQVQLEFTLFQRASRLIILPVVIPGC